MLGPPTGCILLEAGEFTRIDPEQTTGVLIKFNIGKSYAPGIDCLQEGAVDVPYFKPNSGCCLVKHVSLTCGVVLLVEHPGQVTIDRAVQVPVVLLIGMPDGATKQTGGEEESEFLDGRIHDQI